MGDGEGGRQGLGTSAWGGEVGRKSHCWYVTMAFLFFLFFCIHSFVCFLVILRKQEKKGLAKRISGI